MALTAKVKRAGREKEKTRKATPFFGVCTTKSLSSRDGDAQKKRGTCEKNPPRPTFQKTRFNHEKYCLNTSVGFLYCYPFLV